MEIYSAEIITIHFVSYAAIPFKMEILADELLIDWGNGEQTAYSGEEYYQITRSFPSEGLYHIRISGKNISCLDVSRLCLSEMKLEHCPSLESLNCSVNELTELNLEHCPVLEELYCNSNNLRTIDFSKNPEISMIQASYNQLTNLEIRDCAKLMVLYCSNNYFHVLDISGCLSLVNINISNNHFDKNELVDFLEQLPCKNKPEAATIYFYANPAGETDYGYIIESKNWH